MSFPPHLQQRDSGIDWLPRIPATWEVEKFRYVFRESTEKIEDDVVGTMLSVSGYRGVEVKEYDDENRRRSDEDLLGYRVVRVGQLVVNTMWLNYAGLGVSEHEGHVSPAYRSYDIADVLVSRFAHYLMRSGAYVAAYTRLLTGVRPNSLQMSRDDLMSFPVLVPPAEEQSAIADFLDRQTAKIDALVAEQERLIEPLKEKRQTVISHAVTKGLNPDAPMKDSSIAWVGDVPAHWQMQRVKLVSSFVTSGPRGWSDRISDDGARFIQSGDLDDAMNVDFVGAARVSVFDDAEAARTRLRDGDVVVCITGAKTGNVAVCSLVPEDAYINQHICLIRPTRDVAPHYLATVLKSSVGKIYFELSQYGLKQGLSLRNVQDAPIPLPPLEEQQNILARLSSDEVIVASLMLDVKRAVQLLQERRTALISAAVTGQIDVRTAAERSAA